MIYGNKESRRNNNSYNFVILVLKRCIIGIGFLSKYVCKIYAEHKSINRYLACVFIKPA